MSERRPRLPKDVSTIFSGTALPEEVACHCQASHASSPRLPVLRLIAADRRIAVPIVRVEAPAFPVPDEHIEVLMESVACTKGHVCYRSGFETLCKARPLLGGCLVECLEAGSSCPHRHTFLHKAICKCAIRQHIARKRKK